MNRIVSLVWGVLFVALFVGLALIQGSLPDHLAVHFDIAGRPNGFQTKDAFLTTFILFTLGLNAIFLAMSFVISAIPEALINIPWKVKWFSTDILKAMAFDRLRTVLRLGGCFICFVFLFLELVIYQANAKDPIFSFPINAGVFVILTVAVFFVAFSFIITRPPDEA